MKIAAVGDLHYDEDHRRVLTKLVQNARDADALVLCGDLTTHGEPEQMEAVADGLSALEVPVVSVFGNHDCDADRVPANTRILNAAGIHVLDGGSVEIGRVGFAGTKGFPGGFGRGALGAFGEEPVKAFVQAAVDEALKLENALRNLRTPVRVVVLHYAPLVDTVEGEPPEIYPFLGSSRLLPPIETLGADAVFHGHAHTGSHRGTTPGGIPVFNVSLPLLQSRDRSVFFWDVPDESRDEEDRGSAEEASGTADMSLRTDRETA